MHKQILPPRSRPYYPMILANGSDVVLVDYSGSMHCHSGHLHLEQHQGALCGWQKVSHRKVGRHMLSVAFFPYRVMRPDDDVYEVGWFDQQFDPYAATLVTEARTAILHLRITAFMMDGQPLYVERIEVLWVDPEAQPKLGLLADQMADPRVAQVTFAAADKGQMVGSYALDEITGALRVAVLAPGKRVEDRTNSGEGYIEVWDLKPGDVIDRFVTMQDTSHLGKIAVEPPVGEDFHVLPNLGGNKCSVGEGFHVLPNAGGNKSPVGEGFYALPQTDIDPAKSCRETIDGALAKGFDRLHQEHSSVWRAYQANTQISLPDAQLEYEYRLSLYIMRASQHPNGFTTHGIYNVLWGGGACCSADMIAFVRGWASANQPAPIKALADFYDDVAGPVARHYAEQIGKPGTNYPWFLDVSGRDVYHEDAIAAEAKGTQWGGISSQATQCFDVYRYFGDKEDLRRRLPLMKEMIDFLLARIFVHDGETWGTHALIGADENINRVNDSGHLMKAIRAMRDYQEGCLALEMPQDPLYAQAITGLSAALQENYRDGILYPWKGAKDVISTNVGLYNEMMPEGINARSIRASLECPPGEWGLTADNAGRDPNLIWPAHETSAAVAFSTVDPKLSYRLVMHSLQFADANGIIPEKIRPDGFWINLGYGTPHALLAWAVASLLATDNVKRLSIAAGLPAKWTDYSFENIRTPSGYCVSLEMKNGRLKRLAIENNRPEPRRVRLRLLHRAHPDAREEMVTLAAGQNVIVQ